MLAAPVLVLDRRFVPVQITTARRAIVLMYTGTAEALDRNRQAHDFVKWAAQRGTPATGSLIRSSHLSIPVPAAVVLCSFTSNERCFVVRFSRRNVYLRDDHVCQYCGKRRSAADLNLEHVIPRSQGGRTCWANVVCSCVACNRRKGARTPEQAGMSLIATPRVPSFRELVERRLAPPDWSAFVDRKGR